MPSASRENQAAATSGVRRSGRVPKEVAVILSGSDAEGRHFSERTHTLLVSAHGASVLSHRKLIPEQEIYLRVVATNREVEVRICGEIGERLDGHIYGIAFVDGNLDLWKMEFPPAEGLPKDLVPVTLECVSCRRQVAQQLDAIEMDVCIANEGMLRYCVQCGVSTIWKIATRKRPLLPEKPAPRLVPFPEPVLAATAPAESDLLPLAESPAASPVPGPANRRAHRRTHVRYNACIRAKGIAEEVVPCEDMSRGGFSFHSPRTYPVDTPVDAAVPYVPGGSSIFVPARIANIESLQSGKIYRYGVAYVKSGKR